MGLFAGWMSSNSATVEFVNGARFSEVNIIPDKSWLEMGLFAGLMSFDLTIDAYRP